MALLEINSIYQLLICQQCQYAIDPTELPAHLCEKHPDLSLTERRTHEQWARSQPLLSLGQISFPTQPIP